MNKRLILVLRLIIFFLAFVGLSTLVFLPFWLHSRLGFSRRVSVVFENCQNEDINYSDYESYCLLVLETSDQYFIAISSDAQSRYSHLKEYAFSQEAENLEAYIEKSSVHWEKDGVIFIEESGHRLFFPEKEFTAGR